MHKQVELCTFKVYFDDLLAKALIHKYSGRSFFISAGEKIIASVLNLWFIAKETITKGLKSRRDKVSTS
jgi:Mor family transcriptional regulator